MKTGKVSDTILSRAVLKPVNAVRGRNITRIDIGQDAGEVKLISGVIEACEAENSEADINLLTSTESGYMPLIKAVNNIYAAGGVPVVASDCIIMSDKAREIRLREEVASLTRQAAVTGVSLSGGHTTVSDKVYGSIVTVTATGIRNKQRIKPEAGQYIIMAGVAGISGIRQLIEQNKDKVSERYSEDFINKASGKEEEIFIGSIVNILRQQGIDCYMHDVSEGGIFGALWDMCEYGHMGLDVDIRSIPVRQEIIEICELLNINPYELESMGCLLMTADNDCDIINILNSHDIKASVIGHLTKGNQRILRNRDEERFLDIPKQDELYRGSKQ